MLYSPLLSSPLVATRNRKRGSRVGLARWPITNPCQHPASRHYPPPLRPSPRLSAALTVCMFNTRSRVTPYSHPWTYTRIHIHTYIDIQASQHGRTRVKEEERWRKEKERGRERCIYTWNGITDEAQTEMHSGGE